MASLRQLGFLDVARSLGDRPLQRKPTEVAEWILENYRPGRGGGFNYDPATNALFDLFRGVSSGAQAKIHCLTKGNPKGRRQNADAIATVSDYAERNVSTCYRIGFSAVEVGRAAGDSVYVTIKAPLLRVVHDEAFVVIPGFRMSFRPTEAEIDTASSIALATFARDDIAAAEFEYLYAGPGPDGLRLFRPIHGRDRRVYSLDEIDHMMETYVHGLVLVDAMGVSLGRANLRGFRIIDPDQPNLF